MSADNTNLTMNDVLKMAGQKPFCRECGQEYSISNSKSPEWYCSDTCEKIAAEKNYDSQVKYSEAGRCRDTFENNRMRGKY